MCIEPRPLSCSSILLGSNSNDSSHSGADTHVICCAFACFGVFFLCVLLCAFVHLCMLLPVLVCCCVLSASHTSHILRCAQTQIISCCSYALPSLQRQGTVCVCVCVCVCAFVCVCVFTCAFNIFSWFHAAPSDPLKSKFVVCHRSVDVHLYESIVQNNLMPFACQGNKKVQLHT